MIKKKKKKKGKWKLALTYKHILMSKNGNQLHLFMHFIKQLSDSAPVWLDRRCFFFLTPGPEPGCVIVAARGWRLWGTRRRRCLLSSWPRSSSCWVLLSAEGGGNETPCTDHSHVRQKCLHRSDCRLLNITMIQSVICLTRRAISRHQLQ